MTMGKTERALCIRPMLLFILMVSAFVQAGKVELLLQFNLIMYYGVMAVPTLY